MGKSYLRRGQLGEALGHFQQAIEMGADRPVQALFMRCLFGVRFTAPAPALKPILVRAFRELWAPPADLVRVAAPLLLVEHDYREALDAPQTLASPCLRRIAADPLLLTMLNLAIVTDPQLEHLLTSIRHALLAEAGGGEAFLGLGAALAAQCFATEYAYVETDGETRAVEALAEEISAAWRSGSPVAAAQLAVLACYRPLLGYSWHDEVLRSTWPPILAPLLDRQLRDPQKEMALRQIIERLTPIRDEVSKAVQTQYSENPFPQWFTSPLRAKNYDPQDWIRHTFPNAPTLPAASPREVLVAGCGTGQETAGLSLLFADVRILAVDLSLASLAYAKRRAADLKLSNVSFAQADLLELGALNRQFDIVVCAGVLHHLADPLAGLRVLREVTRPGGCLMIALYSQIGRREIVAARDFVALHGYSATPADLRRFRKDVYALGEGTPWRDFLLSRDDFYNLSMLRDLVFHVQEHRFTISQIVAALAEEKLRFCGFASEPGLHDAFKQRFGDTADLFDLVLWNRFEEENPQAFAGMYHFLVQRPAS